MTQKTLFLFFFLPFFCFCVDNSFSVTDLSVQVISQVDPVLKRDMLIEGINRFNYQIIHNSLFFDEKVYNLHLFQYYNLVTLKQTVVNFLSTKTPHLDLSGIPEITKPCLPFWMSFIGFFSGWFCFFVLFLWIYFKK